MEDYFPTRLYKIQNNIWHFCTGYVKTGNQVLMGVQLPELVMVEFDAEGNYLRTWVRPVKGTSDNEHGLQDWQREVEFTPHTISVKAFFLPDRWIGIRDLPTHYQEVLNAPEDYEEERLRELQENIRLWLNQGDFVLYWDEDYYLNQEGELESS